MTDNDIVHYNFTGTVADVKDGFQLKCQGSEAKLYYGKYLGRPAVLKERFVKKYRHPDLDKSLAIERIKFEARAMAKCQECNVPCPAVYFVDFHERCLVMEEIEDSITVRELLKNLGKPHSAEEENILHLLGNAIGKSIANMHKNDIMHSDLTTSNMLVKNSPLKERQVHLYLIDFGLSRKNVTIEDKAVDMYVLERALLSTHPEAEKFNQQILSSYFENLGKNKQAIVRKLEDVRQRGRKRSMIG